MKCHNLRILQFSLLLSLVSLSYQTRDFRTVVRRILREDYVEIKYEEPLDEAQKQLNLNWISGLLENSTITDHPLENTNLQWHEWKNLLENTANFEWKDCSKGGASVRLTSLVLSPQPLHLPGRVRFGFTATVSANIQAPILVEAKIYKKIALTYIHVKTITVPDICKSLDVTTCPTEFQHCHCPFSPGQYQLPTTYFDVHIPQAIPGGQYRVTTTLIKQGNGAKEELGAAAQEAGCLFLELSVA